MMKIRGDELRITASEIKLRYKINVEDIALLHEIKRQVYLEGFEDCLKNYGIWKDGVQRIGCLETSIDEIIKDLRE